MNAAFAILVCCLIALQPESKADETLELLEKSCREELKIRLDLPDKDLTPEERERNECVRLCIVKKKGYLKAGEDVFDENTLSKHAPSKEEKGKFLKAFRYCKNEESRNECKFIMCIADYKGNIKA